MKALKSKKVKTLLANYKEISLLGKIGALLGWDMNVNLPPKGAGGRAEVSAYLTQLSTEKWQDKEFRKMLEDGEFKNLRNEEAAIVRNLNQSAKYYYKVPKKIIIETSLVTSNAFMAWKIAKKENDFKKFLPHLEKIIELNIKTAKYLGYKENPYDALLDLYEPDLTASDCENVFSNIQPELTRILREIISSSKHKDLMKLSNKLFDGTKKYKVDNQKELSNFALNKIGYDLEAGRMDISSHPFTDTLGRYDVRITNRYKEDDFRESLMVAMHEGGHALYEQGVDEDYSYTPLAGGVSLGIHESQSRFWENQIGRSLEFMKFMTHIFHKYYLRELSNYSAEDFYGVFNMVNPSLIRTEADEVTYNLHIALRFEVENGLINRKIKACDLPEIWREKMKKYLGITPKTDREGVLQDVHWAYGNFGYFPTYTLGNLYAAQFRKSMRNEYEFEKDVQKGELGKILEWLRKNIYQYGSLYFPKELCEKVTGEELNPKYFLQYIKEKYTKLYKI
jgi:carboxypeptidase Taq